jgi:hypothetical protein
MLAFFFYYTLKVNMPLPKEIIEASAARNPWGSLEMIKDISASLNDAGERESDSSERFDRDLKVSGLDSSNAGDDGETDDSYTIDDNRSNDI